MVLDRVFSETTRKLMAESRRVAIDLGYNYISTLHLLLADCRLDHPYSIKKFLFKSNTEFEYFYLQQKIDDAGLFAETIPLTEEAKQTISNSCTLWSNSVCYDKGIQPCHLFLAASQLPSTVFYSMFEPKDDLHGKLEDYYANIGKVARKNIFPIMWSVLSRKLFSR